MPTAFFLISADVLKLSFPKQAGDLKPVYIHFDKEKFDAEIEAIPLDDARLRSSWGKRLYRIVLTAKDKLLKDKSSLRIER